MRKKLVYIFLCFAPFIGPNGWSQGFSTLVDLNNFTSELHSMVTMPDNSVIAWGALPDTNTNLIKPGLCRFDSTGQLLDTVSLLQNDSYFYQPGGNFLEKISNTRLAAVCPNMYLKNQITVFDIDTSLNLIHSWIIEDTSHFLLNPKRITYADGYYYIAGQCLASPQAFAKGWICKMDTLGQVAWIRQYASPIPLFHTLFSSIIIENNQFKVAGSRYRDLSGQVNYNILILNYDLDGNLIDSCDSGDDMTSSLSMKPLSDGGYVMNCAKITWQTFQEEFFDGQVMKITGNGDTSWIYTHHMYDSTQALLFDMEEDKVGNIVALGLDFSANPNYGGVLLIKLNSMGQLIWKQYLTPMGNLDFDVNLFDVDIDSSNNIWFVGGVTDYSGVYDVNHHVSWVVKIDPDGCIVSGCNLAGVNPEIPAAEKMVVYPNPASATLNVEFPEAWKDTPVEICILDAAGRVQQVYPVTNTFVLQLHIDSLLPGIYFLQARSKTRDILGMIHWIKV